MAPILKGMFNPIQTRLFETLGRLGGAQSAPLFILKTISARDLKLGTSNKQDIANKMTSFVFVYVTWVSADVSKCC